MATVRIRRREFDCLPPVCMQCGEHAEHIVAKNFWCMRDEFWIFLFHFYHFNVLLPFFLLFGFRTKPSTWADRMTLPVPFCGRHKNHWPLRVVPVCVSAVVLTLTSVIGLILVGAPALLEVTIAALVWIIFALIVQMNTIRPNEIKERSIKLSGVSPEFVRAFYDILDEQSSP